MNVRRHGGAYFIGAQASQKPVHHAIARNSSQYDLPPSPYGLPLQDDHACKTAKTVEEACKLAEVGFERWDIIEGVHIYRKRK